MEAPHDGCARLSETAAVSLRHTASERLRVRYRKDTVETEIECDFVAGCDGFHGVSRQTIPTAAIRTYARIYPFGWLGILSETPPVSREVIYINHERGSALSSIRSHTRSRRR